MEENKMGCDYYAENGKFALEVNCYKTGKTLGMILLEDLDEKHPLDVEVVVGKER